MHFIPLRRVPAALVVVASLAFVWFPQRITLAQPQSHWGRRILGHLFDITASRIRNAGEFRTLHGSLDTGTYIDVLGETKILGKSHSEQLIKTMLRCDCTYGKAFD